MLEVFDFSNGFLSFLDAFFLSFYYSIRFLIGFINYGETPGNFIFCFIIQVILIVIIIYFGVKKGYSGILTFLFCLAAPLLGSFILILLLPDNNTFYDRHNTIYDSSPIVKTPISSIKISKPAVEQKICSKCGEKVNEDIFICPKCKNESFK